MAAVPQRGTRHTIATVMHARRLYSDGWRPSQIVDLLARDGVTVHSDTVRRWTNPRMAAVKRKAQQRRNDEIAQARRAARRAQLGPVTEEEKLARLRWWRECRVSYAAIAELARRELGDAITEDQARHAIRGGRYPVPGAGPGRPRKTVAA